MSQLEVRQQDLIERVQEQLQIDLAEAYEDYSQEDVDWDKVKEQITVLRGKVERLGNVNIDEDEVILVRFGFGKTRPPVRCTIAHTTSLFKHTLKQPLMSGIIFDNQDTRALGRIM